MCNLDETFVSGREDEKGVEESGLHQLRRVQLLKVRVSDGRGDLANGCQAGNQDAVARHSSPLVLAKLDQPAKAVQSHHLFGKLGVVAQPEREQKNTSLIS